MGNSEVGHLNIGAGRVVNQELTRIDVAIEDGTLRENPVFADAFAMLAASGGSGNTLHIFGLLSDGGVHSEQAHLEALLDLAVEKGVRQIAVHAFFDGRDVSPTSGVAYLARLCSYLDKLNSANPSLDARINTLCGRYYAMDRDKRWERVAEAYKAIADPETLPLYSLSDTTALDAALKSGSGLRLGAPVDPIAVLKASYAAGITDEFITPISLNNQGVGDGDTLVFFNFRPDRARELTRSFIDPKFDGFQRSHFPKIRYICMTEYDPEFEERFEAEVAFPKSFPENVLADYLSNLGLKQLHIAETEKYAHVTFFLNGGIEEAKPGEERILINSPKVATYDLQPEMSAPEVTTALTTAIREQRADVYIVNYANGDMVGHTGNLEAAKTAVQAVDGLLKQVVDEILKQDGIALVTADHGNCDQMFAEDGTVWTAHSLNPVPFVLLCKESEGQDRRWSLNHKLKGRLADIAPTLLDTMNLPSPPEFEGVSLLVR
jgi:2,3-bisphosphoglycerate-independent phosphoglycerate mutase